MATFRYKGFQKGKETKGEILAQDRREALRRLRSQGIKVLEINEAKSASKPTSSLFSFSSRNKDLRNVDAVEFLANLLQMHRSGMPVGDAIKVMKDRMRNESLKAVAVKLWQDLSEGKSLADAMKAMPQVFEGSVISAVEAGEASGSLVPILENLVDNLKARRDIRKKILSGLVYPVFVSLVALGVVGMFLFYLMPRIESMLKSLGGELSVWARVLVGIADVLIIALPIGVVLALVATIVIGWLRRSEKGRLMTDGLCLQIPILGGVLRMGTISEIANMMGTLMNSGVNTTEAMKLTRNVVQNRELRKRFSGAEKYIRDGVSLSKSFGQTELMDGLALDILGVGENTGDIAHSFREIYQIYSARLTQRMSRVTIGISTTALIFAFALVSLLALAIVTSVLDFSSSLV